MSCYTCYICDEQIDDELFFQHHCCMTVFHNECISKWVSINDNCPVCNSVISIIHNSNTCDYLRLKEICKFREMRITSLSSQLDYKNKKIEQTIVRYNIMKNILTYVTYSQNMIKNGFQHIVDITNLNVVN